MNKLLVHVAFALCAWLSYALSLAAYGAEVFPTRPVRIIVPTATGSLPDVFSRKLAQRLSRHWGQQVIVDNRPGASTTIGAKVAADASPDGHTLLFAPFNTLVVNPHLFRSLPYDPIRDFAPIILSVKTSFVLVVHESVPAGSVAELVSLAKQKQSKYFYGSGGPGTPHHVFGELLNHATGMSATHVPYKSAPPALNDLVNGQLQFMFEAVVTVQPFIATGKLRPLAVTSRQRLKELPNVPTLSELNVSDEDWTLWGGFVAPAGTPADRVAQLNAAIKAEHEALDLQDAVPGLLRVTSTPQEFRQWIDSESVKWKHLIELSGARLD